MKGNILRCMGSLILLFFCNSVFCQGLSLDDSPFKMEFIRSGTTSKLIPRTLHRTSKEGKFIFVRIRLTSKNNERMGFDPNPISLVAEASKQRIRPTDFDYPILHLNSSMNRVLMEYDENIVRLAGYVYDPEIVDSFEKYHHEDYENITHSYRWGNGKNAKRISYYYEIRAFKKRRADLIFLVPKNLKKASLFYGNQRISNITFR